MVDDHRRRRTRTPAQRYAHENNINNNNNNNDNNDCVIRIQLRETGMKRMLSQERLRWCRIQNQEKLRWNRMQDRGVGGSLRVKGVGALVVYCNTGIRESC